MRTKILDIIGIGPGRKCGEKETFIHGLELCNLFSLFGKHYGDFSKKASKKGRLEFLHKPMIPLASPSPNTNTTVFSSGHYITEHVRKQKPPVPDTLVQSPGAQSSSVAWNLTDK